MRLRSNGGITAHTTAGSEEMSLVQLYIPSEVSHDTISELAEMSNFQFKDVSVLNLHQGAGVPSADSDSSIQA